MTKGTEIPTRISCSQFGALTEMPSGRPNRDRSLQMRGTDRADRSLILHSPLMTQRTRRTRRSTASLSLTGTAGRRQGCVRARGRNISGSASRSLQTTGTNIAGRRNGGSRGRNTVTVILRRRHGLTTALMKGRDSTLNPPFTKA